jgi:hypothetical protein
MLDLSIFEINLIISIYFISIFSHFITYLFYLIIMKSVKLLMVYFLLIVFMKLNYEINQSYITIGMFKVKFNIDFLVGYEKKMGLAIDQ